MAGKRPKRITRPGVDEYGRTPLHGAAARDDGDRVRELLAGGANPNAQDDNGWTALHFAAQARGVAVVERLLASGADPNRVDAHGNGPLWTAVMNAKGHYRVVELLLDGGADPHQKNRHGRTPHEMAVTIGHGVEQPFRRSPERNAGGERGV